MRRLGAFLGFYACLFAAFGVASPFLPALLRERGLEPAQIGVVLGAGTAIRLLTGPAGGRLADLSGAPGRVLTFLVGAAAAVALGYRLPGAFLPLLLVAVAHAAVLAPLVPIADALTVGAAGAGPAQGGRGINYGWVRGAGSAAFIVGTFVAGELVGLRGLAVVVWLNAGLLATAAFASLRLPGTSGSGATPGRERQQRTRAADLLRLPLFARLMVVAGLVQGSHAFHDGFQVIHWRMAGMAPATAGLLWSEAVISEVVVFTLVGPWLLRRIGARRAALLAAFAGVVRWSVSACTASAAAMALVQPLHGLTFAFLHLACMHVIARVVPPPLAATAQAFYGTVAIGSTTALLTFASGPLFGRFGAGGFWPMAALCAAALPVAWRLRIEAVAPETPAPR